MDSFTVSFFPNKYISWLVMLQRSPEEFSRPFILYLSEQQNDQLSFKITLHLIYQLVIFFMEDRDLIINFFLPWAFNIALNTTS